MNDDEYGALLLRPLAGEPGGPPLVDVARAMREGRRMRRRRWAFGGGFLAAFTAALVTGSLLIAPATPPKPVLPPDPPLPRSCTLAALPTGKYHSADVIGGDSTGRWHFGQSSQQANTDVQRTLVWHDGALVGDVAPPGSEVNLAGINSSGIIVGAAKDKTGFRPYVYRNGKFSPLKGGVGAALSINDAGTIVGRLGDDKHPVLVRWRSADAEPERLPLPAGSPIAMDNLAIGPDGTIAGDALLPLAPGARVAETATYLWLPDGTTRRLTAPPPPRGMLSALNPLTFRNGWLYAEQAIARPETTVLLSALQLMRYDPASGTWQRIGGDKFTDAPELPSSGRSSWHAASSRPRVYVGAAVLDLPLTMPLADPEVDNAMLQSISDDGHTVTGVLSRGSGEPSQPDRPVIWRCE